MAFVVSTQIEEQDYPALFEIQYLAFSEEPAILALYPGGLDPESFTKNVTSFKKGLGFADPHATAAKATDKNGNICAFLVVRFFNSNPFCGTKGSDIHFPEVDDKDRPWLEWLFNTKNDRKGGVKELQQPGAYACKFHSTFAV
jgi:hypothetical protein